MVYDNDLKRWVVKGVSPGSMKHDRAASDISRPNRRLQLLALLPLHPVLKLLRHRRQPETLKMRVLALPRRRLPNCLGQLDQAVPHQLRLLACPGHPPLQRCRSLKRQTEASSDRNHLWRKAPPLATCLRPHLPLVELGHLGPLRPDRPSQRAHLSMTSCPVHLRNDLHLLLEKVPRTVMSTSFKIKDRPVHQVN